MESSQRKEFAPRGSEFFSLWGVPFGMEKMYHIKWPPLNVTIFITHVRILRYERYANIACVQSEKLLKDAYQGQELPSLSWDIIFLPTVYSRSKCNGESAQMRSLKMHFLIKSFVHLRFKHTILMTKDCPQNDVRQLGDNFIFFFIFITLFSIIIYIFFFFFFFFFGGGGVYRRIYGRKFKWNFCLYAHPHSDALL